MEDFSNKTDAELISLIQADNLIAFKAVYLRFWKGLYGAAYKRLNNNVQAEEVVQEVLTKLWIKRQSIIIYSGLSNYLYSSVNYLVIDLYRKEMVRQRYEESFKVIANTEIDNSTEETIITNDLKNIIARQVNQLPPKCKAVYELSRTEYKSNKEIAHYLGISEKTVENHLIKALKRLKIGLLEYYMILILFISIALRR